MSDWIETILILILGFFAGHGLAYWQDNIDKERARRSKERREIMDRLREPMWQESHWKRNKK